MKITKYLLTLLLWISGLYQAIAQVENVIVEPYYVSDSIDATDTNGGGLPAGSVTYRIYIDLAPGTILKRIYGDENHALKFSSTETFFNNIADGQTFAKDFAKSRYGDNTVALDTWVTLGQTTRIAAKTYFGVPKDQDISGSFIGGINNDGGSAAITGGLLTNNDPFAGIPLTVYDGMDTMVILPGNWISYGIIDSISGADSTIFGSVNACSEFVSNYAGLQNTGVTGVVPDSNQVLIAQLTTRGEISFELNIEVDEPDGSSMVTKQYVADGTYLIHDATHNEFLSPFLKYPPDCGCTDPDYLEYSSGYSCSNNGECLTLIAFGCKDSLACNYDPEANFNIPSLCCYPGSCNDRDISLICPELSYERHSSLAFNLFPNPAKDNLKLQVPSSIHSLSRYSIYDFVGKKVLEQEIEFNNGAIDMDLPVSELASGVYIFRLNIGDSIDHVIFIKE